MSALEAEDLAMPILLTTEQVAEILAVHKRTVLRLVNRGELACIRFGTALRFDQADVRAFIESRKAVQPRLPRTQARPKPAKTSSEPTSLVDRVRSRRSP